MSMALDYTAKEAADRLGVGVNAVQQAIHRGRLLAVKRGVQWFIDRKELSRWEKARRRGRPVGWRKVSEC